MEVGLTNNEARYNFSCAPCRPHARLLENDFIRTRLHHAVKTFRQARCPLGPQPRRPCYCKQRASCYALWAQRELQRNFASNGIHVSKQLPVALIIDAN